MKIIFFGSPEFAAKTLEYLLQQGIEIAAVVTKPDKPKGRSKEPQPVPVKIVAQQHGLPVYQPPKASAPDFAPTLAQYQPDLFVVVAYGEIIKQHLLDMPRLGCINVHPSLLPKYRGATPVESAIINGDVETGVTIMHMVLQLDAGDIIDTVKIPIDPNMTAGELRQALCAVGAPLLLKVIKQFETGTVIETPQNHAEATFTTKLELEHTQVDWQRPALQLHNLIRGATPAPGAWCLANIRGEMKRIKLLRTCVESDLSGTPGDLLQFGKEGIVVACGTQALRILELQPEGKRPMTAKEFAAGYSKDQFSLVVPQ